MLPNYCDRVIIYNPFQQLLFENYGLEFDYKYADDIIQNITLISNSSFYEYLNVAGVEKNNVKTEIESGSIGLIETTKHVNEAMKKNQARFINSEGDIQKQREAKRQFIEKRKSDYSDVVGLFKSLIKIVYQFDINDHDLLQKELFIKVANEFFLSLEIKEREEIEPNDWNDLFFMLYVNKGDYFWTSEKKWKKIIKKLGLNHYLFEGEIYLHKEK